MPRAQWKVAEDLLCRFFNTTRRPLSGGNDKRGRDDSLHETLFLESKYGKYVPLFTLYREIRQRARDEKKGRTPVIGLREKSKPGMLLVVHSDDFENVVREWAKSNGHVFITADQIKKAANSSTCKIKPPTPKRK